MHRAHSSLRRLLGLATSGCLMTLAVQYSLAIPLASAPLDTSTHHAVIIGLDGVGLDQMLLHLEKGLLPNLARLKREGAFKEGVRSVNPTDSLPNWMGVLSAGPVEFTGIHSNGWGREINNPLTSIGGPCDYFPTIFQVVASLDIKKQQQQRQVGNNDVDNRMLVDKKMPDMAAWFGWEKFQDILRPKSYFGALVEVERDNDEQVVNLAIDYWIQRRPRLSFVYIGEVDNSGHGYGYGSEYTAALIKADDRIGQLIQGLEQARMLPNTTIIVVTDHGRKADGHGHGGTSNLESNTHMFLWGPTTIRPHFNITNAVSILDTSPTILASLGLGPGPSQWRGRPLLEAFLPHTEAWRIAISAERNRAMGGADTWAYIETQPDVDDPCQMRLEQGTLLPEDKSIPELVLAFLLAHFDTVYVRGVLSGILLTLMVGMLVVVCYRGCVRCLVRQYHRYTRSKEGWQPVSTAHVEGQDGENV